MAQADGIGHVAPEAHAGLLGGARHRVVLLDRQPGVDLEQVPSLRGLLPHARVGLLGRADRLAAEGRAGEVQVGSHDLAASRTRLEVELTRISQHAAHGRHPVRDVQEEDGLDVKGGRVRRWDVPVHLRQAGHQELAPPVDLDRVLRQRGRRGGPHHDDPAVFDDDDLVLEHPLAVHRDHVHADERADGVRRG